MSLNLTVLIERDAEGYLVATVPALKGCHTQARSMDDLLNRIKEAIDLCLEVHDEGDVESLDFVGIHRVLV